jgi:phosphate transport system protein
MDAPRHERPFHHQVDECKQDVQRMGAMARESLVLGVRAFVELDMALVQEVEEMDRALNRMDVAIEARVLDLLALHQPMASDLRTLGACLKIITYLDRIGRYGYDIAKVARELEGKQHLSKLVSIPYMAELAAQMLDDALRAFQGRDAALAQSLYQRDDAVDALNEQIFRECVTYMMEDARNISPCSRYILVARHLERAADNACKIAEKTIYMAKGERRLPTEGVP